MDNLIFSNKIQIQELKEKLEYFHNSYFDYIIDDFDFLNNFTQ